jgi:hypothetical protein
MLRDILDPFAVDKDAPPVIERTKVVITRAHGIPSRTAVPRL